MLITKSQSTEQKLQLLSQASQYDLACACGTKDDEHRKRSEEGKWIYPVALPQGGYTYLLKTLLSNECVNNCGYCPLRVAQDSPRCRLEAHEVANLFLRYYRLGRVSGLFLSSGVIGAPDATMSRINAVGRLLRRGNFRGYIHLKVIPGASDAAIEEAVSLASAVSINIETPAEKHFQEICTTKNYRQDIIRPLELISKLTAAGSRYARVRQTTQFVVGASSETDQDIVRSSGRLYKQLELSRIYFSAYQRGAGDARIPGEQASVNNGDLLNREHRLYQVDWLIRKYGFNPEEIPFDTRGNLSLSVDPKESWAQCHPEFFPVDIQGADRYTLLRVPGLGPFSVDTILRMRNCGRRIRGIEDLGKVGKRLTKAAGYLKF